MKAEKIHDRMERSRRSARRKIINGHWKPFDERKTQVIHVRATARLVRLVREEAARRGISAARFVEAAVLASAKKSIDKTTRADKLHAVK